MAGNSKPGGRHARPLIQKDIEKAFVNTNSAAQAARWLGVSFTTFKRYAQLYDVWEGRTNESGKGISKKKTKGHFGLDSILAGEHPTYDRNKLKHRMVAAGYILEECAICGFKEQRIIDFKIPLMLVSKDGDDLNLLRDNLELRCYNCTFLTASKVHAEVHVPTESINADIMASGQLSADDIERMQQEVLNEINPDE